MHVDTPNQGLADELHKLISIIMAYLKWHTFKQAIAYFSVGHSIIIWNHNVIRSEVIGHVTSRSEVGFQ